MLQAMNTTIQLPELPPLHTCGGIQKPYMVESRDLDWLTNSDKCEALANFPAILPAQENASAFGLD